MYSRLGVDEKCFWCIKYGCRYIPCEWHFKRWWNIKARLTPIPRGFGHTDRILRVCCTVWFFLGLALGLALGYG